MIRPRLLPALIASCALLAAVKAERVWRGGPSPAGLIAPAAASAPSPAPAPAATPRPTQPAPDRQAEAPPDPAAQAERALLANLRERRAELERRVGAAAARELVVTAAERRLAERLREIEAAQERLRALERGRDEREEASWRGLVKTYEAMRPRDAAAVLEEMETPVLVQIMDRMREARAAPLLGAMRPDRARLVTAELARFRAARNRPE